MDQVTVLEMGLRLVQVMARERVLEKGLRLVPGMGQELDLETVLAMARDLVLVSENHWGQEKDQD